MTTSGGGYPLSFAQEQLWFLDQLRSGVTEYLMNGAFRLRGPVDLDALAAALTALAERHEVLRTRYETEDGVPVQVIDDPGPVELSVVDITDLPEAQAEREVHRIGTADMRTPIDLRTQWPWRVTVVRLAPDHAVLMITVHHVAFDGWSWGVLAEELSALYNAAVAGEPPTLPPLPVQYADFAEWQREWWAAADGRLAAQLDYWRDRLAGLEPLDLPTDRPRPARWVPHGDIVTFTVPAELARRLADLGRDNGATPFMAHLAVLHLLLSRYSGQRDIAVGVSVAGRTQVELERLIGLFLNTVVLRADLSGTPTFTDLLGQVRDTALAAFANQDVPFQRVVADLAPERDLSRNPLFQVGFAMHNAPRMPLHLTGVRVERYPMTWINSAFDLSLHLADNGDGGLTGSLLYPTALFDRARVERMAANYLRLLADVVDRPRTPVGELALVADTELGWFAGWNRTERTLPDRTLPELFAAQARSTPDAVAVVSDVDEIDYAELAARVERLADHLRGFGVTTETPVGVAMHRGTDLVVALLAVLTAGGIYVPLPPEHPAERLEFMVRDAGVRLVLTHDALRDRLPGGVPVVAVDTDQASIARSAPASRPVVDGANAAYIIYTSGSTGTPKGVVVTHAGLLNRVLWSVDRYGLGPADRVLQKTTIGFDASLWEFLSPLVAGGAVVMAPDSAHRDPAVMVRAAADHNVTVLQLVPSMLRLVVEEPGLAECTALRVVCSAGEPLPAELCERLLAVCPVELVNTYGPTECSIDATAWRYTGGEQADQATIVPIGAPLPNIRAFVVDAADQLVPVGVPGELCLAGVGVARGYLGRGALTAERFTPNPYADTPGERWYRTGDLVRWRADGVLEFVGRVDDQVKVRGVRVEPGEVEAVLRTHPSVAAAVVTPHRSPSGDLDLVAYVVPSPGQVVRPEELREHLAARLPAALVPSVLIGLDAIPLTPSGKVDRAALPDPDGRVVSEPDDYVAPRTATERAVSEIMAELLGVDRVGADEDFFTLGGHSLLAIRLMLRLRRQFDVELTVGELFAARTVERLAAVIEASAASAAPQIRPVARDRDLPLSFGQQRMWFLDQLEPGSAEYLIPLAMRLRGPLDTDVFRRAVEEVSRRHEVLRTRYVGRGGDPVQVIDPPGPVAFELVDLAGAADAPQRVRRLIDQASSRPFDLEREHPLRVTVVRVAEDDHMVAITLHHIVFDAWSMGIFLRDLDAAYRGLADNSPTPLPPPPIQYADFAVWQRDRQSDPQAAAQVDYWSGRLAGLTPVELPTDRPRPAVRDPRGDTVRVDVPDEITRAVTEIGGRYGATPFMTLLAVFQMLLGRYTGRTDIAVGTPVAGRTREETEDVLGFFVNNLVVRNDLSGNPRFVDFLDQVRQIVLEAFANQDVPFEHLVEVVRPDRDLSRNPLFQVMFELAHMENVPPTLGGTVLEPVNAGTPVAKFDLTLSVKQLADGRLRCCFEYATGLFDRATIERMAGHYLRLLAGVAADPTTGIADLDMLTEAERHILLRQWADRAGHTLASLDPSDEWHVGVPELFERHVARTPDAVAVVCGDRQLTYAELNDRANRLAHHLRSVGIGPETAVASCLERGPEAVVALLAVLKAGGVYVPFDPAHPAERLEFMLADADVRLVLTTRCFADRFGGRPVVTVDDWDGGSESTNPATAVHQDNLAYVIYTSGSTGRPKGVMVTHRSYAHHCRVIADAYGIGPHERVVLLSALTFDVAMDQIGATLAAGATIVVADPLFWSPQELPARLAEHGVTIMEITPAYYREMMDSDVTSLTGLKLMNVGSDVVTVSDARRWADTGLPGRFLCNYGPTEATVTCLLHPVHGDLAGQRDEAALPIGRGVAGTRTYVLDDNLRPVPVGVPGELCLGGVRLARGYLGRPGLTADRFVPDPFGTEPGARIYRTGDLVRYRADGTIDFLGRIDQQVKIRGFRIELGEIEAAVARHPAVQAAAVVARDITPGNKHLVAYLVPRPGARPDPGELRAHLRDLLPEYMVPSLWVTLDALPLTASKKVDRAALPAPTVSQTGRVYRAPTTPAEEVVAQVWADVLGVDRVGSDDNFFELGGHSLLATRVLARLRQEFALDIPLRTLFEATTVADLAAAVTAALEAEIASLSDAEVEKLLTEEGVR